MSEKISFSDGVSPLNAVDVSTLNPLPVTLLSGNGIGTSLTNVTTTAYAASLVISATPKKLFGITGYNSKTSGQFIQLHDAASLPANTAVPKVIAWVEPLSSFSLDFGANGRSFATGIVICNSSTGPTKTIGAADCWFDAQVA